MATPKATALKTQRGIEQLGEQLGEQYDDTTARLIRIETQLANIGLALEVLAGEKAPAAKSRKTKAADVGAQ